MHDATVLKRSDFFERMSTDPSMFPNDGHIVGDAAYPLMKQLMVPYKDTGRLTSKQRKFNTTLSTSRCVIERAFALLKGRFRRLKMLDMSRVDLIPKVVVSCCILHNICLDNSDLLDDSGQVTVEDDNDHCQELVDDVGIVTPANRQFAVAKRNQICENL